MSLPGRINKYGYLNSLLRARISSIMNEELLKDLASSPDLTGFFSKLGSAGFTIVDEVYRDTGDSSAAEAAFWREEIRLIEEIKKGADENTKRFIESFLVRYEIDYLKTLLRAWFEKSVREKSRSSIEIFTAELPACIRITNAEEILNSNTLDQIAEILGKSAYSSLLISASPEVGRTRSLFPAEISLDRFYYNQLFEVVESLPAQDRKIVKQLLGVEIDLQNISWLLRYRNLYQEDLKNIREYLIPHGKAVTDKMLDFLQQSQSMKEFMSQIVSSKYSELNIMVNISTSDERSRLILLERILDEILHIEIKKSMVGNPFNIGIIMAYIVMKRAEIRKIITVMNGIIYGFDKDKIMGRL